MNSAVELPTQAPAYPGIRAPLRVGSLSLASRYLLAPLAGYTNLAYRLAVREVGGLGLATTDLVNARALLQFSRKTMDLIQTSPEDRPVAVQIYGANAGEMKDAAQWLEQYGVSSVDINMGCPVHKVVKGGGGSALLCDPSNTIGLVRTVVESVRIPVTVKMRLGWDESDLSAPFFAREFEQAGVGALTVHGRTRAQGFRGGVSLDGIRAVVEAVDRLPIIGNGDIRTLDHAARMLGVTGCAGLAIGRGALLNPWFFQQLKQWEETGDPGSPATWMQRLEFMQLHFRGLLRSKEERFACLTFRKVANWYCRVLRPGRDIQQQLIRLENAAEFDDLTGQIRAILEQRGNSETPEDNLSIPVPGGPIEHW